MGVCTIFHHPLMHGFESFLVCCELLLALVSLFGAIFMRRPRSSPYLLFGFHRALLQLSRRSTYRLWCDCRISLGQSHCYNVYLVTHSPTENTVTHGGRVHVVSVTLFGYVVWFKFTLRLDRAGWISLGCQHLRSWHLVKHA